MYRSSQSSVVDDVSVPALNRSRITRRMLAAARSPPNNERIRPSAKGGEGVLQAPAGGGGILIKFCVKSPRRRHSCFCSKAGGDFGHKGPQ